MSSENLGAIIPARFNSSRFPGKPLVSIAGTPLVVRVANNCIEALGRQNTWVATDDSRIADVCDSYGIQFVMTSSSHVTGTDRVKEAADSLNLDLVVNVQGDEPLIVAQDIRRVAVRLADDQNSVFLGSSRANLEEGDKPSIPKLIKGFDNRVLYVSRVALPSNKAGKLNGEGTLKQVAIYGFSSANLDRFARSQRGLLEAVEDIEILRFLELGITVRAVNIKSDSVAVDYPEDVFEVERVLGSR
mgnify:CR=1 FL=1